MFGAGLRLLNTGVRGRNVLFKNLKYSAQFSSSAPIQSTEMDPSFVLKSTPNFNQRTPRSRVGSFMFGGLFGIFAGVALTATTAYVGIYESYQRTASIVLADIENLERSVSKISRSYDKISALDEEVHDLKSQVAFNEDLVSMYKNLKVSIADLELKFLELQSLCDSKGVAVIPKKK